MNVNMAEFRNRARNPNRKKKVMRAKVMRAFTNPDLQSSDVSCIQPALPRRYFKLHKSVQLRVLAAASNSGGVSSPSRRKRASYLHPSRYTQCGNTRQSTRTILRKKKEGSMANQYTTTKNCHTNNKACSEQSHIVLHPKAEITAFCSFVCPNSNRRCMNCAQYRITGKSPMTKVVAATLRRLGITTKDGDEFIRLCKLHHDENLQALQRPLNLIGWTIDAFNRLAVDVFSDTLNADPNRPQDTVELIGGTLLSENNVGRVGQFVQRTARQVQNYVYGNAVSVGPRRSSRLADQR
jgi:hypothetical protein